MKCKLFIFLLPLVFIWFILIYKFPTIRIFILLLPSVAVFNFAKKSKFRDVAILIFTFLWLFVFHYESLRYEYLNTIFRKDFPKFQFLFPPAGWIMFYKVEEDFGYVEVYGIKNGNLQTIDPHDIFRTRTIMFDNIHRNVLSTVAHPSLSASFCRYLNRRFPYFDKFLVSSIYYPSVVNNPYERRAKVNYQCGE